MAIVVASELSDKVAFDKTRNRWDLKIFCFPDNKKNPPTGQIPGNVSL